MKSLNASRVAGKRAISALLTAAVITSGTAVIAAPAATAIPAPENGVSVTGAKPNETNGQGELKTVAPSVVPGGLLELEGTGYEKRPTDGFVSFLINDGNINWPDQKDQAGNATGSGRAIRLSAKEWTSESSFTAKLRLPADLQPGYYWIRALAGQDKGPAASRVEWFKVEEASATTAPTEQTTTAPTTTAPSEPTTTAPSTTEPTTPTTTAPSTTEPATTEPTSTTPTTPPADVKLSTSFSAKVANTAGTGRAPGTEGKVLVKGLPKGAVVDFVGVEEGKNWTAEKVEASEKGEATVNYTVAKDAKVGTAIVVGYTLDGKAVRYTTTAKVAPAEVELNIRNFTVTRQDLDSGLYQSAYSAQDNTLIVSRTAGRAPIANASIYKLDADTLKVKKTVTPAPAPENTPEKPSLNGAFGVAVDNTRDVLWVTNTRNDTVAAYRASTLDLIWQGEPGLAEHSRDVTVDETTGKAYVSKPTGTGIEVFHLGADNQGSKVETITGVDNTMSLTMDQATGDLYTVNRNAATAYKIATRSGNTVTTYALPAERAVTPSGVAWDAENQNLYIANQGVDNVLVFNTTQNKVVADIPVGGGALNVVFEPKNNVVVATNRGAGTASIINTKNFKVVGNLKVGRNGNHAAVDNRGNIYVVNKASVAGADGSTKDQVTKISYKGDGLLGSLDGLGSSSDVVNSPVFKMLAGLAAGAGLVGAAVGALKFAADRKLFDVNVLPSQLRVLLNL
ncbi:beta-propeller fold lactonase family protein [Corynebacterium suicordis]